MPNKLPGSNLISGHQVPRDLEWEAYEKLPPEVRQTLANCAFKFSALSFARYFHRHHINKPSTMITYILRQERHKIWRDAQPVWGIAQDGPEPPRPNATSPAKLTLADIGL